MTARHPTPIPPFPATIDRRHFASYLSGLVDGEGSFILGTQTGGGSCRYIPGGRFVIRLRADDRQVLDLVNSFLCCGIVRYHPNRNNKVSCKPAFEFRVMRASELFHGVLPHFHAAPLFAKKSRDFEIWEKGVRLLYAVACRKRIAKPGPGRSRGFLPKWTPDELAEFNVLVAALAAQRLYDAPAVILPPPRPPRPEPRSLFDGLP
jgi:hypothetical protein